MAAAARHGLTRGSTDQTRNFWLHIAEGVFASFAGEIVSPSIIFPVIAAALGATPFMLGLLASLGSLSFIVPLFAAPAVEATRRKKRLVLFLGIGHRLPFILIPVALYMFAESNPFLCLVIIAGINLLAGAATRAMVPPWLDLIADTIPRDKVGRMLGYRHGISAMLSLVSGGLCGLIVAAYTFPINYVVLYLAGFISLAVSWLLFALVDEVPPHVVSDAPKHPGTYFRTILGAVRNDGPYRVYLVFRALNVVALAAGPFYVLTAVQVHGMDPALVAGSFIMSRAAARIVGSFLFPFLSERIGHKALLIAGLLCGACAALMAALAPNGYWFLGVMLLQGLGMATQTVSGSAFLMSICPSGKRIGYMTLSMVALAPFQFAMFPAVGSIMQNFGHMWVFLLAGSAILASAIPLYMCRPREPLAA